MNACEEMGAGTGDMVVAVTFSPDGSWIAYSVHEQWIGAQDDELGPCLSIQCFGARHRNHCPRQARDLRPLVRRI